MKSPVVRLKLRVGLPDGTRAYLDPVHTPNHKLKPLYAYHNGDPVHFPAGIYHLRYLKGDRRVWDAVGSDAQAALTALTRRGRELAAVAAGVRVVGNEAGSSPQLKSKRSFVAAVTEWRGDQGRHTHSHASSEMGWEAVSPCEVWRGYAAWGG